MFYIMLHLYMSYMCMNKIYTIMLIDHHNICQDIYILHLMSQMYGIWKYHILDNINNLDMIDMYNDIVDIILLYYYHIFE